MSADAMTGGTLKAVGASLGATAIIVLGYLAWLPDVAQLRSKNLVTTEYVKIYVRRMQRRGDKPATSMTWMPLERISPQLRKSVLIAEDDRFYQHHGVDWRALRKAMDYNLKRGRMVRGASTITQQVARNLFLSPSRSLGRKLKEVLIARHMERQLSKDRILEIYLNIVEWGEGVFGAEAASQRYFGKPASELGPEEAVALAAALPSPYERNPAIPPDEHLRKVHEVYLERLRRSGPLPAVEKDPGGESDDNSDDASKVKPQ